MSSSTDEYDAVASDEKDKIDHASTTEATELDAKVLDTPEIVPPDGGYGWVVTAAAFFAIFCSYGFLNSFGVYAEYYKNSAFPTTPSAVITLIGVLQVAFVSLAAPLASWLADCLNINLVVAVGGIIMCLGMVIASFASQIWMLLVFQGAMVGLGASMLVTLAITAPAQWFTTKRGLASGIAFAGNGFGGVAFSPIIRKLITAVGIGWAARISGILVAVIAVVSSLGIRRLFPPPPRGKVIDVAKFKDIRMIMFGLYSIFMYAVVFIPYFYLPLFATRHGYTASAGSTLALLANLGSAVGRILSGFVSDKIGRFNTLLICIAISLISTLVLWLPFTDYGTAAAYAVIYGLSSGGQITMLGLVVAQVYGVARLASDFGLVMFMGVIGVMPGTPCAGQILDSLGHGTNFTPLIVYFAIIIALQLLPVGYLRLGFSKRVFERI